MAIWRSRRGILELDLHLVPFATQRFKGLSESQQREYLELLEQEDVEVLSWIQDKANAPTKFKDIVEIVVSSQARSHINK